MNKDFLDKIDAANMIIIYLYANDRFGIDIIFTTHKRMHNSFDICFMKECIKQIEINKTKIIASDAISTYINFDNVVDISDRVIFFTENRIVTLLSDTCISNCIIHYREYKLKQMMESF